MTWLSEHCAARRRAVSARRSVLPEKELRSLALSQPTPRPFLESLWKEDAPAIIAEIKFRSPSRGELRAGRDVEFVAGSYERNGASALSVLIDELHFGGHLDFLGRAKAATNLPALAKGFLVDTYEILEARAAGADAVLLIADCLGDAELTAMHALAKELGMAALVEVHGHEDLKKVEELPLELVGVNHRNLHTLAMDLDLTRRLAPQLPAKAVKVAESGLATRADLARMGDLGYEAVLMGTHFMEHADPGVPLGTLRGRP